MPEHSDLKFITNENARTLLGRFRELIAGTELFDVLVGYFYTSGFHALHPSLEPTKKIRILIGIRTDSETARLIENGRQERLRLSDAQAKDKLGEYIKREMTESEDTKEVEEGVAKFLEWLQSGKMEVKLYPEQNIHAKLYIMSFNEGAIDAGRVITGSSNFTEAGLSDNLEFNVELKDRADYEFAKAKFEELWENAINVKEEYLRTIQEETWFNKSITPYELYLKFLYEYFKDELNQTDEIGAGQPVGEFKDLQYQRQAALNAKRILEEYGGVFLSDVVGLGKTYMAARLAQRIPGGTIVIAPPTLINRNNSGSWPRVFNTFGVRADYFSAGNLDDVYRSNFEYENVIIDESHRFRNEFTKTYEDLSGICRGKKVILVSATPVNNSPSDILAQIKLFQSGRRSNIPNLPNLEEFFSGLERNLAAVDRREEPAAHIQTARSNAKQIRESVLKYLMVRRTRREIETHFAQDLQEQGLKFPKVEDPTPDYYQLNKRENEIFVETLKLITQKLHYTRYTPLQHYSGSDRSPSEAQAQRNLRDFMKILMLKRLESSFHAFGKTLERFIGHHARFLKEFDKGRVYVSKKEASKIFKLLADGKEDVVEGLIDQGRATKYLAENFKPQLKTEIEEDLETLQHISHLWGEVKRDPKLLELKRILSSEPTLKAGKLIIFTESKETAEYLKEQVDREFPGEVISLTGDSSTRDREVVIENFDAGTDRPANKYRILITTDVFSEGVNLHRSNVVVNYDIPWNPTRLMQRVGRINRIDTKFEKIHIRNFFPTEQSNDQIHLKEAAQAKIQSFITLLGADARLLTEGENIESHELFTRLTSKETITGEGEEEQSELKHLHLIRDIRNNEADLFERIRKLPQKARCARKLPQTHSADGRNRLLTYFRKDRLQKFFLAGDGESEELDFITAAGLLETDPETRRENLPDDFYIRLKANREAFAQATSEETDQAQSTSKGLRGNAAQLMRRIKALQSDTRRFTEEDEDYLKEVRAVIEEGSLPHKTVANALNAMKAQEGDGFQPLKMFAALKNSVPGRFLKNRKSETDKDKPTRREVILSEYML